MLALAAAAAVAAAALPVSAGLHHVPLQRSAPPSEEVAAGLLARKGAEWAALLGSASAAAAPSTKNLQLVGNVYPLGIYGTTIGIGSPLQELVVAVDSGSCTLLVPAQGCDGCNVTIPKFNPKSSSTISPAHCIRNECTGGCSPSGQCQFYNSYQTCNLQHPDDACWITGPVWHDVFSFGDGMSGKIPFGTITKQSQGFEQLEVIGGICGFACETTFFGQPTPMFELVAEGKIEASISFCFGYEDTASKGGFSGGVLTLGGYDKSLATAPMQYTPLVQSMLYVINMSDVQVAGKSIGVPPAVYTSSWGGTVLDSGTNILLLPQAAFDALYTTMHSTYCSGQKNLKGLCGLSRQDSLFGGKCFQMAASDVAAFPPLELQLAGMPGQAGFTLSVPPEAYLLAGATNQTAPTTPPTLCFGVKNTGHGGFSIIGDTVMAGYVMLLDRGNSRVGFAPADRAACSAKSTALRM